MKILKKISILMLFLFTTQISISQEHFNELSINYGVATTDAISSTFGTVFEDIVYEIFGDSMQYGNSSTGVFLFTYQHQFSKIISAGPVFGYELLETDVSINDQSVGKIKHHSFTLAIEARVDYLNKEMFGMYLGLGFGASLISTKSSTKGDIDNLDPDSHFNFHITALGFRFGKKIGATAEIGYGYRGLFNGGLYYRF